MRHDIDWQGARWQERCSALPRCSHSTAHLTAHQLISQLTPQLISHLTSQLTSQLTPQLISHLTPQLTSSSHISFHGPPHSSHPGHVDNNHPNGIWVGKVTNVTRRDDDSLYFWVFFQEGYPLTHSPTHPLADSVDSITHPPTHPQTG